MTETELMLAALFAFCLPSLPRLSEGTQEPHLSPVTIGSLTPAADDRRTEVHNSLPAFLSNAVRNQIVLKAYSSD